MQLQFAKYAYIEGVDIYEIYCGGAVTSVKAFTDQWVTMWTGTPQDSISGSRIFSPPIQVCVWGRGWGMGEGGGGIIDIHITED